MASFKKYCIKFIVLLVALQTLNTGLFAQDFELLRQSTTQDTNIINSLTEYVSEVLLQKKNSFPEHNDPASQQHRKHSPVAKQTAIKLISIGSVPKVSQQPAVKITVGSFEQSSHYSFIKDINPPPPKA